MEPAKIDWKSLEWRFVEDKYYEQINAPKWFDFLNPNDNSVDDQAWFCRPGCKHPKTAEDFLKSSPPKVPSPAVVPEVSPLGDKVQRDVKLKRRGLNQSSIYPTNNSRFKEEGENQNPNLSTPPMNQAKAMKATIKSSTEKKQPIESTLPNDEVLPKLRSTLSARNLFAGRDLLNQITDFCSELKRMAMRAREGEDVENSDVRKSPAGLQEEVVKEECNREVFGELKGRETERMPLFEVDKGKTERQMGRSPLLEVNKGKNGRQMKRTPLLEVSKMNTEGMEGSNSEKPRRKKRDDEAENIPIPLSLENVKRKGGESLRKKRDDEAENVPIPLSLENVKHKGGESLLQIRTNPPSPQRFSATRPPSKITPSKASKSKLMERRILGEAEQNKKVVASKDDSTEKGKNVCLVDGREARALDVFWFLKPCTTLST
ncbi:uncharacterized protein [Malus domestica]|uniref:uncharacterized protein isoform X2 n=1 Tax=Malus domestica TaxID=3750 RepID=UPI0010A998AB|nr:uncharacterized protein LOC103438396 isoform X2 [Malus domestica]